MNLLEILQQDYQRFPQNQTYSIYAENVYFQDPLTKFRGLERYKQMIQFIQTWFLNVQMEVHQLQQVENTIHSRWTLSWNTPLPWKPRISISGRSELQLNSEGLIQSHIDYWDCSPWNVLQQHIAGKTRYSKET